MSASKWKLAELNDLGISYKGTPDDLQFFSEIIENKINDNPNFENISLLGDTFVKFTAKYLIFSIDLNTKHSEHIEKIFSLVDTVEEIDNDLSHLKSRYDRSISSFLPTDTVLRKKALEEFARYIDFHTLFIYNTIYNNYFSWYIFKLISRKEM